MIIQVYDDDLLNGEGIREVVFLQGCPHHCKGCFNPETWEFKYETEESIKNNIKFISQLDSKLQETYISGITISGGEPLVDYNLDTTLQLVYLAKKYNKSVWIYSGYTWNNLIIRKRIEIPLKKILNNTDILCEGPFIEELKSPDKPWVGSSNQRVIDVQKSLKENKVCLRQ